MKGGNVKMRCPNVSVVILNWNGRDLLKLCLSSLKNQVFRDFEVVIVDNGSSDGSVEFVEENYPKAGLIKNDRNLGFARAANQGIRATKGDLVFLLNNDTELDKNCLLELSKAISKYKDFDMFAPKVLSFYERKVINSAGVGLYKDGTAYQIGIGENNSEKFDKGKEVFGITAGAGLYHREVFDRVGLFDERFGSYFEDVDLAFRARLAGLRSIYIPSAVVYHVHKATSDRIPRKRSYYEFRNPLLVLIKNMPIRLFLKYLSYIMNRYVRALGEMMKRGYVLESFRAIIYVLVAFPIFVIERIKIMRSSRVTASDLEGFID